MTNSKKTPDRIIVNFVSRLPFEDFVTARITSNSMAPVLKRGETIRITRTRFDDIKVGDIVAITGYKRRRMIVHRVIQQKAHKTKRAFVTKGDNAVSVDRFEVTEKNFIGTVA